MDLYVFDKHFTLLGIVDRFTSLIWTREYHNVGTLELHVLIDSNNLNLLQKGNILVKKDNPEEAMYINSIYMNRDIGDTMIVRGFSLDNLLEDRVNYSVQTYSGRADQVIQKFVAMNAVNPKNANRKIPYLNLGTLLSSVEPTVTESYNWAKLPELVKELSLKYDIGWRIRFDSENKKFWFDLYRGKDSSVGQNVNPHKIFSSDYENIFEQSYMDSDTSLKTMVYVGGPGEGEWDQPLTFVNDELTGYDRKELYTNASDITNKDENGEPITSYIYFGYLRERGKLKLKEFSTVRTFESGVSVLSNLAYRKDFDLGDKVTIENRKWGLVLSTRITSIEEIYENNTSTINISFGDVIPTLETEIKRAVK